jgi:hypothetical protein
MKDAQRPASHPNSPRRFVGIDLAGDSGITGVAVITENDGVARFSFPPGKWKGTKGLLSLAELIRSSEMTSLDQPFSFPGGLMRLLNNTPSAIGDAETSSYCSRRTDTAMRAILATVGLAADYVMSPNRCQNIWRALALAKFSGFTRSQVCHCAGRLVETHPRVAWTVVLTDWKGKEEARRLVETYKGESWSETQRSESRKAMLAAFEAETGIFPAADNDEATHSLRTEAWDSVDKLEALICAYVAVLRIRGETVLAGFTESTLDLDVLETEGAAVLPRRAGQSA